MKRYLLSLILLSLCIACDQQTLVRAPAADEAQAVAPVEVKVVELEAAQEIDSDEKIEIVPAEGIGRITLGMSEAELALIMGKASQSKSFDQAFSEFKNFGYKPKQKLVFFKGFDTLLIYDQRERKKLMQVQTLYPLFRAYFKDGSLVHIVLSSHVYEIDLRISYREKAIFLESPSRLIDSLGEFHKIERGGESYNCKWFRQGISSVVAKEKIRTIELFEPMDEQEIKAYLNEL